MKNGLLFGMGNAFRYEHLEHKSFPELYALKREAEQNLMTLRRHEPSARKKKTPAYTAWVGRNVECIERLERIRSEILRRKERAIAAGVSVLSFDQKCRVFL